MTYTNAKINVVKRCYDVWMCASVGSATPFNGTIAARTTLNIANTIISADWVKIGALSENPTLKTAEGDTVALADCTNKILSEIVEFACEILEVTPDNWNEVRTVHGEKVDIIFAEGLVANPDVDEDAIGTTQITLSAQLEITGNDMNKVLLTGKVETSNATSKIGYMSATHEA